MSTKSEFVSPAYGVQRVPIDELVSQKANPNQQSGKAFSALMTSIMNTGFSFPVIATECHEYDPSTEGKPKPNLIEAADGGTTHANGEKIGTQVSDDEIAKYFKFRLVDGSHRTMVVRLGTHYFRNGHDKSDAWSKGEDIPEAPGPDMLAYIAWRENFSIPCVVLELDPVQAMSAEVLHNPIHADQELYILREFDEDGNEVEIPESATLL